MTELFYGKIAVDLDGTLARNFEGPYDPVVIGDPVPAMAKRVEQWLHDGVPVVIFTARVWTDGHPDRDLSAARARVAIQMWCRQHFGIVLPITNQKLPSFIEFWDDRAIQIEKDTGLRVDGK